MNAARSASRQPESPADGPTCYRHPDRRTYLRCNRCERYICGECMRTAAVGQQCGECVRAGARTIRQPRTRFGGRQRSGSRVISYALIANDVAAFMAQMASGITGGLVAAAYVYPPRDRRNVVQLAVTIVALVVLTALIWWRTNDILAEFGEHLNLG